MEAVGAAASILAIAGAGIQISLKLIAFADQVGTAPESIRDVGTDVSVMGGTLKELGELMGNKTSTEGSAAMFTLNNLRDIMELERKCDGIFEKLRDILGKASLQLRSVYKRTAKSQAASPKITLSKLERMKWPFLQPSMESLRSELRDAKGTLTMMLQVVHLRHAQIAASLDREEQHDLIRMIAAMSRNQSATTYGTGGGYKGLDAGGSEDSETRDTPAVRIVLEAWSVTPNTLSNESFQHFLITPIPISQRQIAKVLEESPQDFREIASMIDSLSFPERDAILERVLGNRQSNLDGSSSIRSISSQSWTGSHDLFGKVTSRKFKLIVERRVRISKSSRTNKKHEAPRVFFRQSHATHDEPRFHSDSAPLIYDSFCDSDGIHKTEAYTDGSSQSPPPPVREHRHELSVIDMIPLSDDDRQRKQRVDKKSRKEQFQRVNAEEEKKGRRHGRKNPHSHPWVQPRPVGEVSDYDLVKSLLAQYTNFELEEPLVRSNATPPPTYDEASVVPKRAPRPY